MQHFESVDLFVPRDFKAILIMFSLDTWVTRIFASKHTFIINKVYMKQFTVLCDVSNCKPMIIVTMRTTEID